MVASGTGPYAYQWSKDGTNIVDATNSTYAMASIKAADAGNYCAVVTGLCNSITNCASLTVKDNTNSPIGTQTAGGPFSILRFAEPDLPDVVYLEQLTSALYLDKPETVDSYLRVMERICMEAATPADSAEIIAGLIAGR